MPVSGDNDTLFCRPLSAVMDHRRCTQLQREGGHSQISRFLSAESALALPHYSRQQADATTGVPQPGVHSRKPASSQPHRVQERVSTSTQVWSRSLSEVVGRKKEKTDARSPSQARLVSVVWRRRGVRPVFRPDFSMAGKIKPRRFGAGSAQISPRPYGSRTEQGWRSSP